jgi:hypothetical protein
MKKLLAMMLATSVLYVACSDSDDVQPRPKPESISAVYQIDKETHAPPNAVGGNAKFEYSGDNVMKRLGGYISIAGSGGSSGFYTESIYDSVQYLNKNTIRIFATDNIGELNVSANEREITLEGGRMVRKITSRDLDTGKNADTIFYYYDSQNRIKTTEQHFEWFVITKTYTFDAAGNLTKISGVKEYWDGEIGATTEETFGGYDDKPNPLKGLCLWQDYFYRSLSNNNFTSYTYISGSTEEAMNWNLVYDINGNVDYSK